MISNIGVLNKFMLAFKAEGLKLKRRKMIKLSYLIPVLGLVFLAFGLIFADDFKPFFLESGVFTFEMLLNIYVGFFLFVMFPAMIAIYTASISSVEREAKTEFTLGVLPTSHFLIFLAKILKNIINTVVGVFVGLVSVMIFAVIANNSLEWFPQDYSFGFFWEKIYQGQIGSLLFIPIIILHTWIGERLNVKLLNMFGMMFIGLVATLYVINAESFLYLPHSLPVEILESYKNPEVSFTVSLVSYFAWLIGLLGIVYLDLEKNIFKRKK